MTLFFDTETTGWATKNKDEFNRLVQIAWLMCDGEELVASKEYIVRPDGFKIPENTVKIHGISTERAIKDGVLIQDVLSEFRDDVHNSDTIVCHNVKYDIKVIGGEFQRLKMDDPTERKRCVCTKLSSMYYVNAQGKNGVKWPRLSELYRKLFNEDFDNAHDAMADIQATARCYFELIKLNVI